MSSIDGMVWTKDETFLGTPIDPYADVNDLPRETNTPDMEKDYVPLHAAPAPVSDEPPTLRPVPKPVVIEPVEDLGDFDEDVIL